MTSRNRVLVRLTVVAAVLSAVLPLTALQAGAATLTFNTSDSQFDAGVDNQGWWSPTESNFDGNDNYIVGRAFGDQLHNDFFTFDLSGLTGTVTGATLEVQRFTVTSPDPTETVGFFDVSTDAATLNANDGTSQAIFDDLGTGASYGSVVVDTTTGMDTDIVSVPLNAAAVAAINAAAGGFFSVGGSLTTLSEGTADEYVFGFSVGSNTVQRLVLETDAETGVPGAPTDVAAFPGDGSATVDWAAPASDGGSPIDLYEVSCVATENPEDQQTATTPDGSTTALTVGGLTNGVEYTCTVRAHNANGFGPSSAPSNPVTPSAASEATVIDGSQGGTVTTTSPGLVGKVQLKPGATSDEVVVAVVLSSDDAPAPGVPACADTICLDVAVSPADAYPATKPISVVLQFLSIPPDPLADVLSRPVFKDEVLIDARCPTKPAIANPDPCWQKRRLVGKNHKWEQIVLLASSEDPRFRT